jgi:hypothetical protein
VFNEDLELIAKVKHLWMVVHQKPYVPTSRMIFLSMVGGMVSKGAANKGDDGVGEV